MANGDIHREWNENAMYVLKALENNEKQHKEIAEKLDHIIIDVEVLKTRMAIRAGAMGSITGAIVSIIVGIILWLVKR